MCIRDSPYFARVYRDNLKAKLSGWNLLTGLSSIKMNMICGERSSCGEQIDVYKRQAVLSRSFNLYSAVQRADDYNIIRPLYV